MASKTCLPSPGALLRVETAHVSSPCCRFFNRECFNPADHHPREKTTRGQERGRRRAEPARLPHVAASQLLGLQRCIVVASYSLRQLSIIWD